MTKNQLYVRTDTGFNSIYVTKLLRNYRSRPACLYICLIRMFCNSLLLMTKAVLSSDDMQVSQGNPENS